jgi:hypothetical protein
MKGLFTEALILACLFYLSCSERPSNQLTADILIIGGGASGTTAGIQAARMGASVILLEETPWLGGMLTSAGVSAIDGNYSLHSGLWEEFRQRIYHHYGGEEKVKTGWVSKVMFEPQIGAAILDSMTFPFDNLFIFRESGLLDIRKTDSGWDVQFNQGNEIIGISATLVIDATELGDVVKRVGIPYDVGMDSKFDTGEDIAPEQANDIIQDLTYVAILKDYGEDADRTMTPPKGYDPSIFRCTCAGFCDPDSLKETLWDCQVMINYGKLPHGYYMINWPIHGNDYYVNMIEMSAEDRRAAIQQAKNHTLSYIFYLQNELGFRNLGLAEDVYPTADHLPFIPYYRESRRVKGLVRFTINDLARPYGQKDHLYRTGIAVGDYPVDHHHAAYPEYNNLPDLHFYPVPSYTIPLGTLIPDGTDFFIVAEKSISVSNIVNGTTRLQPVCLLIGQAAGTLAALSIQHHLTPADLSVRKVQQVLLESGAYILPYSDINPSNAAFLSLQRIGATGILKGKGKNTGWENHTYIYPDSMLFRKDLQEGLRDWLDPDELRFPDEKAISLKEILLIIQKIGRRYVKNDPDRELSSLLTESEKICNAYQLTFPDPKAPVDRKTFAVLLDQLVDPFSLREIDHKGNFIE